MQSFYRIIVIPYGYDIWDIFIRDKETFDKVSKFYYTDDLIHELGVEAWEELTESYDDVKCPYVLLGEHEMRQPD